MKTFENQAAQGDMLVRRIAALPPGVQVIPPEDGHHIVAHSESAHHHVIQQRPGVVHYSGMDALKSYLVVPEGEPVPLEHLRSTHTHETLMFAPGIYELTRQREYDMTKGWRLAAD